MTCTTDVSEIKALHFKWNEHDPQCSDLSKPYKDDYITQGSHAPG